MLRLFVSALILLGLISPGAAQTLVGSYFCASEFSAGIDFDITTKKWGSKRFQASSKFILRVSHGRHRIQRALQDETVTDYLATITQMGANFAAPCTTAADHKFVGRESDHAFACQTFYTEYRFNLRTMRFLAGYFGGFVDGKDDGNDTPAMSAGTCTKIE